MPDRLTDPQDFLAYLERVDGNPRLGPVEKFPKLRFLLERIMDERLAGEPYTVQGLCQKTQLVIRLEAVPYFKRNALHRLRQTANAVLHEGLVPADSDLAAGVRILAWCLEEFYGLAYTPAVPAEGGPDGVAERPAGAPTPPEAAPDGPTPAPIPEPESTAGTAPSPEGGTPVPLPGPAPLPAGVDWLRGVVVEADGEALTVDLEADGRAIDGATLHRADWADTPYARHWEGLRRGTPFGVHAPVMDAGGRLTGRHLIIEPDVLVDVSTLARCAFKPGRGEELLSPWLHWAERLQASPQNEAMLKGNVVNGYLDRMLQPDRREWDQGKAREDFKASFRRYALAYTMLGPKIDGPYMHDCARHHRNVHRVIHEDLPRLGVSPDRLTVEPSYVVPSLGLQGRMDVLALPREDDEPAVLLEVKSGKLPWPQHDAAAINADHQVQLHAYRLMLQTAHGWPPSRIRPFLLYSSADVPGTNLRTMALSLGQARDLLALRNAYVLIERALAEAASDPGRLAGFIGRIRVQSLADDEGRLPDLPSFMAQKFADVQHRWNNPAHPEAVRRYAYAFLGFIARERWRAQVGDGQRGYGHASLWRPAEGDPDAGSAGVAVRLLAFDDDGWHLRFARSAPDQPMAFRPGDTVLCFPADAGRSGRWDRPVIKGALAEITDDRITLRLVEPQQERSRFVPDGEWTLHGDLMLHGFRGMEQALVHWLGADARRRDVILGLEAPSTGEPWPERRLVDEDPGAAPAIAEHLNDELHRALSAGDWFLLQGPPGTGKTSRALRAMIRSHLRVRPDRNILVLAYTNRAVDELSEVLERLVQDGVGFDYIRLGRETSTDPAFRDRLLDRRLDAAEDRGAVQALIEGARVWVTTVATAQNQMDFLASRRFAVAFLDEASQLLEPQIVGLLTLTDKAVLIGDPKQLPAVVVQPSEDSALEDPVLAGLELHDRREAYFERLLRLARRRGWAATHTGMLLHQGRMHPAVAEWPNRRYYDGRLQAAGVAHQLREGPVHPLPAGAEDPLLAALCRHRVLWIDSRPVPEDRSYRVNSGEARTVVDVLERWIHRLGLDPDRTGVITPYRQQIQTIRAELDRRMPEQAPHVLVDTVERFQGSQRDAILYSFSVNDPMQLHTLTSSLYEADGQPAVDRKLNVALTRAREQVVLIGNRRVLGRNEAFADLMAHAVPFGSRSGEAAYGEGPAPARAADDGGAGTT